MRGVCLVSWLGALGALAAGCFGGNAERTEGFTCGEQSGVCAEGLRCQYGYCRRSCARDADCADGGVCIASLRTIEILRCALKAPAACTGDDGCGDGEACAAWDHDQLEERRCALDAEIPCTVDTEGSDCPAGASCAAFPHDAQDRVCTLPWDVGCSGGDCPDGSSLLCVGGAETGVCREGCDVQRPCAEGYECVDSACVEKR